MHSAYVEFDMKIMGQRTTFRIFETRTHLFLYISQDTPDSKYFNKMLEKSVFKKVASSRKRRLVFCRLKGLEYLKSVSHVVLDVLEGRSVDRAAGGTMKAPPIEASRRVFVYASFFLACVRLLGVTKISPGMYTLVALSYMVEVCWFAVALYFRCFSVHRVSFEIAIALFSLSWMIFLYPYYLIKTEDRRKSA
ncbi:UNVERIFIED_CONTAM: hypothetical protein PYX00_011716 [Menopon gallinae]|uniref:Uncharacterized protein n=1 Tax=Menopon gallinae TaxID=328185 RepID=A0AAW2H8I7_9NEOP